MVNGECERLSFMDAYSGYIQIRMHPMDVDKTTLVDGVAGCELLSFMDAYSGYIQIRMHPMDVDKTTFIRSLSNFCYIVMSFGLKNAGATYQRLIDRILEGMICRNVEAYMDDMVVKYVKVGSHVQDLKEFF